MADPRGRGFRARATVEEVRRLLLDRLSTLGAEPVALRSACGRVLAAEAVAAAPTPPFDRAAMDGYAIRGEESFGADVYTPAIFQVVGRSRPGAGFEGRVEPGRAVAVATGAPIPDGADAVAPVEICRVDVGTLHVSEAVTPGRHVGRIGEDFGAGTVLLPAGRILRPQDLGVLSAAGFAEVGAVREPRAAVIVTGDELLQPGSPAVGHRIADMNSVMLAALIERDGGAVEVFGPMPDDRAAIRTVVSRTAAEFDVVLISGGSSTGPEDHAPGIISELGELVAHGVALRPASPTGVGFVGGTPVLLLPGNPVSCLCAYDLFGGLVVRRLGGLPVGLPHATREGVLIQKLSSALGRVDYARVRFVEGGVEPLAIGGASILSGTTRADGFVLVPADLEGYPPGAVVTVRLYDTFGHDPHDGA